jgi:hypothetical protein
MRLACAVSACALTLGLALPAHAFERQWHLGAALGPSTPTGSGLNWGPAAAIHGAYGLSDMFDVRLELLGGLHAFESKMPAFETTSRIYSGTAGLAYKLDVIEWVPYAGLLAGYGMIQFAPPAGAEPPQSEGRFTLGLELGIDYALSRSIGLGFRFRGDEWFGSERVSETATFLFGAEYRWGY